MLEKEMQIREILNKSQRNRRYGKIWNYLKENLRVSIPVLRKMAKEIGKDHKLALQLWDIDIRETRILASMIDEPDLVTEEQMEKWVRDFDCWEVRDQVCQNLFTYTKFAYKKAVEWSKRDEEFIKRVGFALIAWLAFKDKDADDVKFEKFFSSYKKKNQQTIETM